ncbi:MAG: hypothetical protein ACSHXI_20695 [Hoeflea sp.]|uniref:hypothetical protein n=1 Tax=Hoeflea sp. TaxID=1940281 RepID=UPI003EF7B29C
MADEFKDFFDLKTDGVPDVVKPINQKLYDAVKGSTNHLHCYEILFQLCLAALKNHSIEFRKEKQIATDGTRSVLDADLQNAILAQLDEELTDYTEELVLFEGATASSEKNPPAFKFTVSGVDAQYRATQTFFKRREVNDIIEKLGKIATSPPLPTPLAAAADIAAINTVIDTLVAWIEANIPAVAAAKSADDWPKLLTLLFGPGSPLAANAYVDSDRLDAAAAFCRYWRTLPKPQNYKTRSDVVDKIRTNFPLSDPPEAPWNGQEILKKKYIALKACVDSADAKVRFSGGFGKGLVRNSAIFGYLGELWAAGLSPSRYAGEDEAQAKRRRDDVAASILATLKFDGASLAAVAGIFNSIKQNLIAGLHDEFHIAKLSGLKEEGAGTVPAVLPEELLRSLKSSVDRILSNIPLTYKATGTLACEARILPIDNLWDLKAASSDVVVFSARNRGSFQSLHDKPYVVVRDDPYENGYFAFRPVCDYADGSLNLLNLSELNAIQFKEGSFFFLNRDSPQRVITEVKGNHQKIGGTDYADGDPLQFDFQASTINGKSADGDGRPFFVKTMFSRSKVYFISTLKTLTKWGGSLKGNVTYLPYFETQSGNVEHPIAHLRRDMPAGSGTGIGRADTVADDQILWSRSGSWGTERLPEILGLPLNRQIKFESDNDVDIATIDGNKYKFHIENQKFKNSQYTYSLIQIERLDNNLLEYFVRVNTPSKYYSLDPIIFPISKMASKKMLSPGQLGLKTIFDFSYYRRIDENTFKIIKNAYKDSARRPGIGDGLLIQKSTKKAEPTKIGINLPVAFTLIENARNLTKEKSKLTSIKNKGKALYKAESLRDDAGTVMAGLINKNALAENFKTKLNLVSRNKLPATNFVAAAFQNAPKTLEDWQAIKNTQQTELTVNQEWCHLLGHGDSGQERLGNFVAGSYHCNTEQLAMEQGLRETTHRSTKGAYLLRTTAYLMYGDGTIMAKDYLANDAVYTDLLALNKSIVAAQLGQPPSTAVKAGDAAQSDPSDASQSGGANSATRLPICRFIRYKIIYLSDPSDFKTAKKVWDHTFEGQSEFFDRNQYVILNRACQFALAGRQAFTEWYADSVAALDEAKAAASNDQ